MAFEEKPSQAVSELHRLDQLCDRFEQAWKAGESPRIEDYLPQVAEAERAALLRELISLEIHYLRERELIAGEASHQRRQTGEPSESAMNPVNGDSPSEQTVAYVLREEPGTIIAGRYKLLEAIGQGGMGTVWMAEQTQPVRRKVALKLIKAGMDSKSVLARFEAERQALAVMDHPNIAKVLDGGLTDAGRPYFVMEYVKGVPITEYCEATRLSIRGRLELFVQVCQAMQHAHQKGIIHRDLKPSNILVAPYDDRPVPKVIDFGLAKAMHQPLTERTLFTAHDSVLGTPLYMSPEQAQLNNLDIDTRSDLYSLGVLLYELLTGTTPVEKQRFRQAAWDEIRRIIREEEPPRPSMRLSSSETLPSLAAGRQIEPARLTKLVRGELDWIVMKSLEKDRTRRYETANGFAMDIQRYLAGEPVLAAPPSARYRLRKFARKHRAALTTAAAMVLLLVAGVVVSSWQAVRATRAETTARTAEQDANAKRADAERLKSRAEAERKKAEAAADRERAAREAETITLADARTSLGLNAAGQNNPYEAVLWFASAANLARTDPQRELANRTRFATWARRLAYPVAVLPHPREDVTRVVFHPSDDYLLAFIRDGYVLYDVRTSQPAILTFASKGQGCAEWSPDGKLLALGDAKGRVDIYSFPECRLLHALKHPGAIRTLRFSDDGGYLAIGSNVVRVWSTAKKEFLAGEVPHPQAVAGIDFDPAGQRLVTSCLDNMARVFSIDGKRLEARPLFPPTEHAIRTNLILASGFCATFVKSAGLLVTKDYHALRLLDAETGAEIRQFVLPREYLTTVRVSPDRGRFIMCGKRLCQLCDVARRDDAAISLEQPQGTPDAAFNPDGKSVITAGNDEKAHFWSALEGQPLDAPLLHQDSVRHIACSPSGKFLATAQRGGLVRIWRLPPPAITLHVPARPVSGSFRLALSTNGRFALASGEWPGRGFPNVHVYETASGGAVGRPLTAGARVNGADFSPNGKRVIAAIAPSSSGSGGIVVWDWRSGEQSFPTIPTPSEPADVAYCPRGDYAVAVCAKGEVLTIDANTVQVRKSANHGASKVDWWQHPKRWVVFSPDGSHFATLGLGNVVRVWTATGELACSVQHQDVVRQAVFSPKGNYLATASHDSSAQVCDVASGKVLAVLRHPGWVFAVQFSPDQRQLLTACSDGMARLWDWEKARLACPGFEHKDEVWDVGFLPHQPWILTLGMDSTVRGWDPLTGTAISPPLGLSPGLATDLHDLMIARDGRLIAVPGTGTFDVCDVADTGLAGRQDFDLAGLQSLAELYACRQIVGSGTVKLTADEWLQRWKSLLANYSGSAPVEAGGAPAGYGGFTQVVRRVSAASIDAEARTNAAAARRLALIGKPLQVDGTALDGKPFDWNAYRGKVTLIEFWTTYSAESETLLTATRAFYELYHDVGLEVVGVSLDEDRQLLDRFVAEKDVPWATLYANARGRQRLANQCGIAEVPISLLVDRGGNVVMQSATAEGFGTILRKMLGPPFQGPLTFLDLQSKANWSLEERHSANSEPGNNLASLPRGESDICGVKFNIGASTLRLGGRRLRSSPERIQSIPVNARAAKLYFLHATAWGANDGTAIGEYVIHFADGAVRSVPIVYGRDVRDFWATATTEKWGDSARPATRAITAWRGRSVASAEANVDIQLFLSVWKNPRPEAKIASLDYVSAMTDAAPFCVAITAEGPVPSKSAQQANGGPSSTPQKSQPEHK